MNDVPKLFGSLVFNESVMKDRLPTATYKAGSSAGRHSAESGDCQHHC